MDGSDSEPKIDADERRIKGLLNTLLRLLICIDLRKSAANFLPWKKVPLPLSHEKTILRPLTIPDRAKH